VIAHNTGGWAKICGRTPATANRSSFINAFTETDEARFVIERIRQWVATRRDA
jgi:hypothetical protein